MCAWVLAPRLHAALAAGFGGALAVVGEVAGVVARPAAAMAVLAAAATRLDRLLPVVGKIPGIAGAGNAGRGVGLSIVFHLLDPPKLPEAATAAPDIG
jgi:hypothetical protein